MPREKAMEIIRQGRGSHFDPDIVDAFLAIHEEFRTIAARFIDGDEELRIKAEYLGKAIG